MKVNIREFFTKSSSFHLALVAGALVSGGCAPQVFKPRASIPPPVVEPPQLNHYKRPIQAIPEMPTFKTAKPVITPVAPTPPAVVKETLPELPPVNVKELTYKVKKGDSFWKIGRQYGLSMNEIAAYNNLPLRKPLTVGQVLTLPPGAKFVPVEQRPVIKKKNNSEDLQKILDRTNKTSIRQPRPDDGKHVVMRGDSLWKIAKRYNLKTSTLAKANNLSSKAMLKIGQVLIIPGKKADIEADRVAEENEIRKVIGETKAPEKAEDLGTDINTDTDTLNAETLDLEDSDAPGDDILNDDSLLLDTPKSDSDKLEVEKIDLDDDTTSDKTNESMFEDDSILDDSNGENIDDKSIDDLFGEDGDELDSDVQTEVISIEDETITLDAFSKRFGVKVEDVKKLNNDLPADGNLKKGMKVKIPIL